MTLEEVIGRAVLNGLDTVSLSRLGLEWQANCRREGESGWSVRFDQDPALAARKALALIADVPEPPGSVWGGTGCLERLEASLIDLTAVLRKESLERMRHGR